MKVTLRMKPITDNRQTLYLDYYPPIADPITGKSTRREFLKLSIYSEVEHDEQLYTDKDGKQQRRIVPILDKKGYPKKIKLTDLQKHHNRETMSLAEAVKAKRQLSIQNENYGFLNDEKQNADFINYFESLANKRSGSNSDNWHSALLYLKDFTGGKLIKFKDVSEAFCNDFREYLLTAPSRKSRERSKLKLSTNSAVSYYNKFKASLKQAYKDGYLKQDLNKRIEGIKPEETERQYLTYDELRKLAITPCKETILKKAAIFSALTGLRFSDIKKLVWGEVQYDSKQKNYIRFRQKKTKGAETLPIPEQAFRILGERGNPVDLVFPTLEYSYTQTVLPKWLKAAGIHKDFSFHGFRHTYATLQLTLGTDIYTVSKMLGHRDLKPTQVYTKVIDKLKTEAAEKITLDNIE